MAEGKNNRAVADTCDADGRRLVIRNGQSQKRTVTCGAGAALVWRCSPVIQCPV